MNENREDSPPGPETPPPIVMKRMGEYRVYQHGDDEYFWNLYLRFKAGEVKATRIRNAAKERDLFLLEDGGRKYVLKIDRGGWGFGGESASERFLLRLLRGPFYSRLMERVRLARQRGCDMIQQMHLVAEKRTLHFCHEAVIILDYLEGKMLIDAGDLDQYRPRIREAMLKLHEGGLALCDVSVYNYLVDDEGKLKIIDLVCRGNFHVDRVKDAIRLHNVVQVDIPVTGWIDRTIYRVLDGFQRRRRRHVEKHNKLRASKRLRKFREPVVVGGEIVNEKMELGVVGLGVMGASLAMNIADHGHSVAVFNRHQEHLDRFMANPEIKDRKVACFSNLDDFVDALQKPAAVLLMITAGEAVDDMLGHLKPLLRAGDIVIDGGNSFFRDSVRRSGEMAAAGLHFIGMGVSGGEEGARHGPSLMPGGSREAYERVAPVLNDIAAKVLGVPCCGYVGPDGAGHYVKMVHNGIEYADMQLIAEAYSLLKDVVGLDYPAMAETFSAWNDGDLESYLIEITADILGRSDPDTGRPIPEVILDVAGQKGTGLWTSQETLGLGVAAPTLIEAVQARAISAAKAERVRAAGLLVGPKAAFEGDKKAFAGEIGRALYAAKLCCYAQGFGLLAAAARAYGWKLDLGVLASMWRGGCIIRARFLQRITDAYGRNPDLDNLLLDDYFREVMERSHQSWRRVAAAAIGAGVPVPALTSALSYYDSYRAERLPANLIQAQRDYFGAHTYKRVDRDGDFHTDWVSPE